LIKPIQEYREREPIHQCASTTLPNVRWQRVRRVADNCDAARRPSLEFYELEAIIATAGPKPIEQICQVRERGFPRRFPQRRRLCYFVAVQHRQRDIDLILAAWGKENASAAGPIFNRLAGLRRSPFVLGLVDQQADGAVG